MRRSCEAENGHADSYFRGRAGLLRRAGPSRSAPTRYAARAAHNATGAGPLGR